MRAHGRVWEAMGRPAGGRRDVSMQVCARSHVCLCAHVCGVLLSCALLTCVLMYMCARAHVYSDSVHTRVCGHIACVHALVSVSYEYTMGVLCTRV